MNSVLLLCFFQICLSQFDQTDQLDTIAQKLREGIAYYVYNLHTTDRGYGTDCMKINYEFGSIALAVFHKSNPSTKYSQLYYTSSYSNNQWINLTRISQRGSMGTIFKVSDSQFLVAYQLENHQHGNTIAIRFYQNVFKIYENNFLYQYQISQIISDKSVRNIGTPSLQSLTLKQAANQTYFNEYQLKIKFHYSPDGSHDYPGYGYVNLKPLRDFVDKDGNWKGGSKQNYLDWKGFSDNIVLGALRSSGCGGKIGQRDYFDLNNQRFYLYECNINPDFDWRSWRIYLYSPSAKRAINIGISFDGNIDIANPHISLIQKDQNHYKYALTVFLPSQGVPGTQSIAGQLFGIINLSI